MSIIFKYVTTLTELKLLTGRLIEVLQSHKKCAYKVHHTQGFNLHNNSSNVICYRKLVTAPMFAT